MSYIDSGFDKLLYKTLPVSNEMTEDRASSELPVLTGTSIAGGVMRSQNGRIEINFEKGYISISDGANKRFFVGEDGL